MSNLFESLAQQLNPRQTEQLAKRLDLTSAEFPKRMSVANALVLGAVHTQTATPQGADELLASLNLDRELKTDVMHAIESGHGYPILDFLFGVGLLKAAQWVRDTAGIDVVALLPVSAVLWMHVLKTHVLNDTLDAAGLTALLDREYAAFQRAEPQLASQIAAAIDLGQNTNERALRLMERFTPEEWDTLARLPSLASAAIMMTDLSGPVGLNKEYTALLEALEAAAVADEPDSLVALTARSYNEPAQIDALGITPANAQTQLRDACLNTLAVLNDKATHQEIFAYKKMVVEVARKVAQAANDGGLLGLGGKPVSADEQRTLDLLAAALAYQA